MARFLFTLEKTPMFPTCKLDPGKAQGTTSLIAGAFLYADFYGTFNSIILNKIEAGSRLMQQLDAVLHRRIGCSDPYVNTAHSSMGPAHPSI